jgi:hypothetical protein
VTSRGDRLTFIIWVHALQIICAWGVMGRSGCLGLRLIVLNQLIGLIVFTVTATFPMMLEMPAIIRLWHAATVVHVAVTFLAAHIAFMAHIFLDSFFNLLPIASKCSPTNSLHFGQIWR